LRGKTVAFAGQAPAPEAQVLEHPLWQKFWDQVADDLNSPRALAVVWDVIKDAKFGARLAGGIAGEDDLWLGLDLPGARNGRSALERRAAKTAG